MACLYIVGSHKCERLWRYPCDIQAEMGDLARIALCLLLGLSCSYWVAIVDLCECQLNLVILLRALPRFMQI